MYAIGAFAELTGVTIKALRHYERRGLLAPRRTAAGYRRYTRRDLERLEGIIALKSLGLSLKQIATLVDDRAFARLPPSRLRRSGEPRRSSRGLGVSEGGKGSCSNEMTGPRLVEMLRAHREQLAEKRRRLDGAIAALDAAEHADDPSAALRRFVGDASWARWEAKRKARAAPGFRAPDRVSPSRLALFREIEASLGDKLSDGAAVALAARWEALVDGETAGDPESKAQVKQAWANRSNWPAGLREYVASCYGMEYGPWEKVATFISTWCPASTGP